MLFLGSAVHVSGRHQEGSSDAAIKAACHCGAHSERRHVVVREMSSKVLWKRSISSLEALDDNRGTCAFNTHSLCA